MKTISLLLTETVDNLGIVGDVVEVRPGYARNFLLPRNLATTPTKGAIKALSSRRAVVEKEMKVLRGEREAIFEKLKGHEITILRSANDQGILYGGVSQHEIAEALRADGFAIDDRAVRIGEQIKRLDSYHIPIALDADLKCEIKLWVVSDKPREDLDGEKAGEAEAEAAAPVAPGEAEEKPARKSRKKAADAEVEVVAAPAEEKKPRKSKAKAE
ncbi:MAG: 50S ribosomal protein L9 [Phycisphaeraceae bacterium]